VTKPSKFSIPFEEINIFSLKRIGWDEKDDLRVVCGWRCNYYYGKACFGASKSPGPDVIRLFTSAIYIFI
jgi:hypothetical protein